MLPMVKDEKLADALQKAYSDMLKNGKDTPSDMQQTIWKNIWKYLGNNA